MGKVTYRIQSKILGPDGKPDFVKFGTSENIEATIKYHKFNLKNRTHPDPQLMRYTCSRGVDVLEFIVDTPEGMMDPIVEQAVVKPIKEQRTKKKSG
jgi:hypothetical protein